MQAAYKNARKLPGCDIKRRFLFNMSGCSANDVRGDMSSGRGFVFVCFVSHLMHISVCMCVRVSVCSHRMQPVLSPLIVAFMASKTSLTVN